MIEALTDLPDGVIGFRADGKIHARDYTEVLAPAIEDVLAKGEKVRIVLVFDRFDGLSGGAVWQDLEMGVEHLTRWERIALVTDVDWMVHLVHLFGWMTPGEMRHLPADQLTAAAAWAADS